MSRMSDQDLLPKALVMTCSAPPILSDAQTASSLVGRHAVTRIGMFLKQPAA